MCLPKRLIVVLIAGFLTASCSSSMQRVPVPPKPLPAALAQPCQIPVAVDDDHPDSSAIALKQLYDQYGHCAGLHWDTVQHIQSQGDH